jgi:hypothetical protein
MSARFALSDVAGELERIVEERLGPAISAACELEAQLASAKAALAISEESLADAFRMTGAARIVEDGLRECTEQELAAARPALLRLHTALGEHLAAREAAPGPDDWPE